MNATRIRGSHAGAGPAGEPERGAAEPRLTVSFWCASGHETQPVFSAGAEVPVTWECAWCDSLAGQDRHNPPARVRTGPKKTHLQYVKDRRSPADRDAILAEALARLHGGTARHLALAPPQADGGTRSPARQGSQPRKNSNGARAAAARPARRHKEVPGAVPGPCARRFTATGACRDPARAARVRTPGPVLSGTVPQMQVRHELAQPQGHLPGAVVNPVAGKRDAGQDERPAPAEGPSGSRPGRVTTALRPGS